MRLSPASRAVLPSSKSRRHPCRRRAPGAERKEILFWVLLGDCAPSFLSRTDPRRTCDPQKRADRWRGRPKSRAALLLIGWPWTGRPTPLFFSLKRKSQNIRRIAGLKFVVSKCAHKRLPPRRLTISHHTPHILNSAYQRICGAQHIRGVGQKQP